MRSPLSFEYRVLALGILAAIIPLGSLLYFFPRQNAIYWAWVIPDPRSAMLIGSVYLMGILYFALTLRTNDWVQARNGTGALLIFSITLLLASIVHYEPFRPYHPTTLIWLTIYYAGPLFLPIIYVRQDAAAPTASMQGTPIAAAWRRWLIARGAIYLTLTVLGFIFAERLVTIWPWTIQPLEVRTFTGQLAAVGWLGISALNGGLPWKAHRLGLMLNGLIGLAQLVAIFVNVTPYTWSSPLGIILPLIFLEWLLTPLSMALAYEKR